MIVSFPGWFATIAGALWRSRRSSRWIRLLVGLAFIVSTGVLAWSLRAAIQARDAASAAAGTSAACIQVSDGDGSYRPATSLGDLSPVVMRTNDGRFHGVLVVDASGGRKLYNWSYRRAIWSPLAPEMRRLLVSRCAPRRGYVRGLGWLTRATSLGQPSDLFRLGSAAYLIPASFRPKTQNGTYLSLDAPAPNFDPGAVAPSGLDNRTVSLSFGTSDWLESLAAAHPLASDLSTEPPQADDRPKSYVDRDSTGRVETVIHCPVAQSARHPAPCQHRFHFEGAMWSFRQSMDELPRWRDLQDRLKDRIGAFSAAAARCEADPGAC